MSSTAPTHDVLWYSREKDADWLSAQLRLCRLTVLQGQSGSGKSVLLRHGVLPRLTQRATDPRAALASVEGRVEIAPSVARDDPPFPSVVVPFPDRRRGTRQKRIGADAEVVVFLDAWDDSAFETVWIALHVSQGVMAAPLPTAPGALADTLRAWHRDRGLRFLLVFDDFDVCLKASTTSDAARRFVDEWVQCVSDPRTAAHFLIAMSQPAEPLWRLLKEHLFTLGELEDHRLELSGAPLPQEGASAETAEAAPSADSGPPPEPAPAPALAPAATPQDAKAHQEDPAAVQPQVLDPVLVEPAADPVPGEPVGQAGEEALDHALELTPEGTPPETHAEFNEPAPRKRPRPAHRSPWPMAIGGLAVLAFIGLLAYASLTHRLDEEAATAPGPAASAAAGGAADSVKGAPLPAPGFELVAEAGSDKPEPPIGELVRLLTPADHAAPAVLSPSGWEASLAALREGPRVAMMSGDVLQAARHDGQGANLRLIAPLFPEEIYFVVRHDSSLRYVHQIRRARFAIGPGSSSSALTAQRLYQRLFGSALPSRQTVEAGRDEGLEHLLARRDVDVLVLVGAQPDPWLAQLPPERRDQLRLLNVDPKSTTSRRAVSAYPIEHVPRNRGSGLEPPSGLNAFSVMSYLVADSTHFADSDREIYNAAEAFCHNLPELQGRGHERWRDVAPGTPPRGIDMPVAEPARRAISACPVR